MTTASRLLTLSEVLIVQHNLRRLMPRFDEIERRFSRHGPFPETEYGINEWPVSLVESPEELPVRALNCLSDALDISARDMPRQAVRRFVTPFRVSRLSAAELMRVNNFGRKCLNDVRLWLGQYGLKLRDDASVFLPARLD
jgi:DNA-directed RNA polymerase alpha subunit